MSALATRRLMSCNGGAEKKPEHRRSFERRCLRPACAPRMPSCAANSNQQQRGGAFTIAHHGRVAETCRSREQHLNDETLSRASGSSNPFPLDRLDEHGICSLCHPILGTLKLKIV